MFPRPVAILLALAAAFGLAMTPGTLEKPLPGQWSAQAAYLWPGAEVIADYPEGGRKLRVSSPSGEYALLVEGTEVVTVDQRKGDRPIAAPIYINSLAEAGWGPDSSGFFITESDGGYVGTWFVRVFLMRTGQLEVVDVTKNDREHFRWIFPRCPDEFPNMVAVGWVDGSRTFLVAGEMPCRSSCVDMCKIFGYVVEVPSRKILERFDSKLLRRRWRHFLGPRLATGD